MVNAGSSARTGQGSGMEIETERLILRPWRDADAAPFAAMNADPEVMRFFPSALGREESDAVLARVRRKWDEDGISFAAAEAKGGGLIGFCGLNRVTFAAPFAPAVEIGWRLARGAWGQGYPTEAARGWLAQGFGAMGLAEIVAFTVPANAPSRAVMQRLGMRRDPGGDFDHPMLPVDSPLRAHVLYRLTCEEWTP